MLAILYFIGAAVLCLENTTCVVGCATCETGCQTQKPACAEVCRDFGPHCSCAVGYVLGPNDKCILENECPWSKLNGIIITKSIKYASQRLSFILHSIA